MGINSSLDNLKNLNSADEMDKFITDAKNYFDKNLGDVKRRYPTYEKIYFSLACNFFKSKKLPEITHVCFDVSFQMLGSELKRNPELKREDFAKVCAKIADNMLDPQEASEFIQNTTFQVLYKFLSEQQEESTVEESKVEESAQASAQRQDPIPNNTNERQNPIPHNINERQDPNLPNLRNNSGRNDTSDPMIRAVKETIDTKFNEQTRVLERNNQEQTRLLDEKLEKNNQELARTTNEIQHHLRDLEGRIDREITKIRDDLENRSIELSQAQLDKIVQRVTQEAFERLRKERGYSERDMEAFRGPVDVHIKHSAAYNVST